MTTDSHRLGVPEGDSELRNLWRLLVSHLGRYRRILVAVAVLQLLQSIALLYLPTLALQLMGNNNAGGTVGRFLTRLTDPSNWMNITVYFLLILFFGKRLPRKERS